MLLGAVDLISCSGQQKPISGVAAYLLVVRMALLARLSIVQVVSVMDAVVAVERQHLGNHRMKVMLVLRVPSHVESQLAVQRGWGPDIVASAFDTGVKIDYSPGRKVVAVPTLDPNDLLVLVLVVVVPM